MVDSTQVELLPSAVFTRLDEQSGVVLELTRKRYFMLSESATHLLERLQRGGLVPVSALFEHLEVTYEADRATIEQDVRSCLGELEQRNIVRFDRPTSP